MDHRVGVGRHAPPRRDRAGGARVPDPGGRRGRRGRLVARADRRDLPCLDNADQHQGRRREHPGACPRVRLQPPAVLAPGTGRREPRAAQGRRRVGLRHRPAALHDRRRQVRSGPQLHDRDVRRPGADRRRAHAGAADRLDAWPPCARSRSAPAGPRCRMPSGSSARPMAALAVSVVGFGIQSSLDWTWYFPGVAVPVLLCAGWLAGRGPLAHPVGWLRPRGTLLDRPGAAAAAAAVVIVALAGAWLQWQPQHSADEVDGFAERRQQRGGVRRRARGCGQRSAGAPAAVRLGIAVPVGERHSGGPRPASTSHSEPAGEPVCVGPAGGHGAPGRRSAASDRRVCGTCSTSTTHRTPTRARRQPTITQAQAQIAQAAAAKRRAAAQAAGRSRARGRAAK